MNAKKLFRLFLVISSLGFASVLILSNWGISKSLNEYNIENVEKDSINVAYALFHLEQDSLVDPQSGKLHRQIPDELFAAMDANIRLLLSPMHIIKIKVFDTKGVIIYSTDKSIIGSQDIGNSRLDHALEGGVNSSLTAKESVADLTFETRFNVDVVETYLPMYNTEEEIIGAYETYRDITPFRQRIEDTITSNAVLIGSLILLLFTALVALMHYSTHKLSGAEFNLQKRAERDSLTGLFNHGFLKQVLNQHLHKIQNTPNNPSSDEKTKAAILLIDVDHFKSINDKFGHLSGDEALRTIADRLKENIRESDVLGRYGGEEFLVLLPRTTDHDTELMANRAWQAIRETPIELENHSLSVTVSIGFTNILPGDKSIDEALARADGALYQVKENGRDHIARA